MPGGSPPADAGCEGIVLWGPVNVGTSVSHGGGGGGGGGGDTDHLLVPGGSPQFC